MMDLDRVEISRAIAKAIAYKQCEKHAEADLWAARLLGLLDAAGIINPERMGLVAAAQEAGYDAYGARTNAD